MFASTSMALSRPCLQSFNRIVVTENVRKYVNGIVNNLPPVYRYNRRDLGCSPVCQRNHVDPASNVTIESPRLRMFSIMSVESCRLCLQCYVRITVTEDVRKFMSIES